MSGLPQYHLGDGEAPRQPTAVMAAAATVSTRSIAERKVVVADPAMARLYELIEQRLAAASMPVLIQGETGTGKELVAAALHHWSSRRERPLVALNCAAIPEQLLESELFGYDKGAFSGAVGAKPGLIESAFGGTLFLDEIGELPPPAQAKLLRVLETRRVRRLGELREREIDVRIVAATCRSLEQEVQAGRFRKDLYFRLKGAMLWLPPLRDRTRELPILAEQLLTDACLRARRPKMTISAPALGRLVAHAWPGNVRELQSLMEYVAAVSKEAELEPAHVDAWTLGPARGSAADPSTPSPGPLAEAIRSASGVDASAPSAEPGPPRFRPIDEEVRELERTRMLAALAATGGNRTRAAELIQMPLRTFVSKLKVYEVPSGPGRRIRGGRPR